MHTHHGLSLCTFSKIFFVLFCTFCFTRAFSLLFEWSSVDHKIDHHAFFSDPVPPLLRSDWNVERWSEKKGQTSFQKQIFDSRIKKCISPHAFNTCSFIFLLFQECKIFRPLLWKFHDLYVIIPFVASFKNWFLYQKMFSW